jgi:hypothetical protein
VNKATERSVAFVFGVVFVIVLLLLAIKFPNPTPFQYTVFRIVLALAAGGVAAMIPGFLTLSVSTWLRAGGALAVFVIVYFYSPAGLTGVKVKTDQDVEIEKPVVQGAQPSQALPNLVVTKEDQLSNPTALAQRYQSVTIDHVRAKLPAGATLVANEIEGLGSAALVGPEFSVVARHLANLTIDASGGREAGAPAGRIRLYAKLIENVHILATGTAGAPGRAGDAGANGANGANGRDGDCHGFGAYHGADPGGPGGDAGNGHDGNPGGNGQAGGFLTITTVVNPVSSAVDVKGGEGGPGGAGGTAGKAGHGGTGGRGCTGLGGSQPNQADGHDGNPGQPGQAGPKGHDGKNGDYNLRIVKSFDPIVERLSAHSNEQLNAALLAP